MDFVGKRIAGIIGHPWNECCEMYVPIGTWRLIVATERVLYFTTLHSDYVLGVPAVDNH